MTDFRRDTILGLDPPDPAPDLTILQARLALQVATIGILLARVSHLTHGVLELATFVDSIATAVRAGGTAQVSLLAAVEDFALRVRALEMRCAGKAGAG